MAKYNWEELKKEFILGDYSSLKDFADKNNLNNESGAFKKNTKGWKEQKALKKHEKSTKVIEKTIEKTAEKEANRNARILDLSDRLANKIDAAIEQLENYIVTNKKKTKTVKYNEGFKPIEEVTTEEEAIEIIEGLIDKQGLKTLTAALKDIKDINTDKQIVEHEGGLGVKIINDIPRK